MKIEELISSKSEHGEIAIEGTSIPVSALRKLISEGYVHLMPYRHNKTFHVWGKRCTACFTEEALRQMADATTHHPPS
jgi:hypothetical protein